MSDKILLSSPHMSDEGYEMKFIKEAFDTNWIAPLGENVNKFEEEFASYIGVGSAAALSSGTAAIHLAIKAAGIKKKDIVFCQALTFAATCNPVVYENATLVFIDSDNETYNMNPKALKLAFEKYPEAKAVIVVNLYGNPAKLDEIKAICDERNVVLIEDAAESLGSTYKGKMTGTFGKYGIFSFNGNKIITTSGGGMLVSNDKERIEKARFWATQSREKAMHYEHKEIGYNYRLSNICAGIGRGQLKVIDKRIEKKNEIFNKYKNELEKLDGIKMIEAIEDSRSNHWLSVVTWKKDAKRSPVDMINKLNEKNIEARRIWKPMQLQPVFAECDFIKVENNSVSEDLFERGLCLPSDTKMTKEQQDFVISELKKCLI